MHTLTLFSVPKPFRGHIGLIQRNALSSWGRLDPHPEILLFGREEGVADAAAEWGARHFPDVATNQFGTPLLSEIFRTVRFNASGQRVCYVNADIILLSDFVEAAERIALDSFLMVGRRWDWEVKELLGSRDVMDEDEFRTRIRREATLHPPTGSDYFLYPSDIEFDLPRFAVGRPGWDNWLIFEARRRGIPVVDVSELVTVIHQNHGYEHVPRRRDEGWEGPEADQNRALATDMERPFTLLDATHVLKRSGVRAIRRKDRGILAQLTSVGLYSRKLVGRGLRKLTQPR